MADACCAMSPGDFRRVWIATQAVVTPATAASAALTPRFSIDESQSGLAPNVRFCDGFRSSDIDDTMSPADAALPANLDAPLAATDRLLHLSPGGVTDSFSSDCLGAYNHVPIVTPNREFATIVTLGPDGCPYSSTMRSKTFGTSVRPDRLGARNPFPEVGVAYVLQYRHFGLRGRHPWRRTPIYGGVGAPYGTWGAWPVWHRA